MPKPLIRINYATPDEIATLHGVGKVLANRIVEFRKTNGYFSSPDDLAKVDGISIKFAIMLSVQIDWQVPSIDENTKEQDWGGALYVALLPITALWLLFNKILPNLNQDIEGYQLGYSKLWVWIWVDASISMILISETIRGVVLILREISNRPSLARIFHKAHLILVGVSVVFAISSGLGHATYYQFYAKNGWGTLLNNPRYMVGLLGGIAMGLTFGPQLLVYKYPKLAQNSILATIFDTSIIISAPVHAFFIWINRNEFPIWFLVINIIPGIAYLFVGWIRLQYGKSFFSIIATRWLPLEKSTDETGGWIRWINLRLPDTEQQKALKQALETMYPPSKFRKALSFIVFGAGGWILSTVLGSVIDWLLQNWLDKLIR